MVDGYETIGDPDDVQTVTKRDARRQTGAERLRVSIRRMHFHEITSGESVGSFTSHTHEGDELGHEHDGRQAFPRRADGGYWEETGPSLGTATPRAITANLVRVVEQLLARTPTPDHLLMRWRLRLFCGHVIERTAHRDHTTVAGAFTLMTCPECGLDPATIVAARALGLVSEPPPDPGRPSLDRRRAQRDLAKARREVARLERDLGVSQSDGEAT
jgi:hypothetical protein